jgi:RNA polymerase sigma-70 factor, ECF subfamily
MTDTRRRHFESIAAEVFEPLQRFLRRRADRPDADEALGETLLVLWRRIDDIPEGASLPWAYGVARRVLANQQRATRRRRALEDRLAAQAGPYPSGDPAEDGADPEVAAALGTLAESDREVLILWAWEELEPREIAVVLGTSVNAATLRLGRAKKKLARALLDRARQDRGVAGHIPVERHIEDEP